MAKVIAPVDSANSVFLTTLPIKRFPMFLPRQNLAKLILTFLSVLVDM
jgi:hypothetical protein